MKGEGWGLTDEEMEEYGVVDGGDGGAERGRRGKRVKADFRKLLVRRMAVRERGRGGREVKMGGWGRKC